MIGSKGDTGEGHTVESGGVAADRGGGGPLMMTLFIIECRGAVGCDRSRYRCQRQVVKERCRRRGGGMASSDGRGAAEHHVRRP